MIIQLKIEKEHFYFLVTLIAVLFAVGVNAYANPNTHVGHDANETGPGMFGGNYTDWFAFPGSLRINNTLNMSGNLIFENITRGIFWGNNTKPYLWVDTGGLLISSGVGKQQANNNRHTKPGHNQ